MMDNGLRWNALRGWCQKCEKSIGHYGFGSFNVKLAGKMFICKLHCNDKRNLEIKNFNKVLVFFNVFLNLTLF